MPSPNLLRERWLSANGARLAEEVTARLVAGRPLNELGLGAHEGCWDLRGLLLPAPQRLARFEAMDWFVETMTDLVEVRGVSWSDLDLTGAELAHLRFFNVKIANCRFEKAKCRDWRLWASRAADCYFAGADLRESVLGSWDAGHRNEWRRVDFSGADLRGVVSRAALYEDCGFATARLDRVRFEQCALKRCRFAGPLREVVFDGREIKDRAVPQPLADVDMRGTRFDRVEFMGYRLDQVALPDDPDLRLITDYRRAVERGLERLAGNESRSARMLSAELRNRLRMMRAKVEDNVLNLRDYRADGDEVATLAAEIFESASG